MYPKIAVISETFFQVGIFVFFCGLFKLSSEIYIIIYNCKDLEPKYFYNSFKKLNIKQQIRSKYLLSDWNHTKHKYHCSNCFVETII